MDKKSVFQTILVVIFAGLIIIGGFYFSKSFFTKKEPPNIISASGRIEGDEYNACTKVGAKIEKLLVGEGDTVKKGDKIAVLSSKQIEEQLAASRKDIALWQNKLRKAQTALGQAKTHTSANVDQAKANLAKAAANFAYNEKEYIRYKNLFNEDAVPKTRFDAAQTQYIAAKQDFIFAKKELEKTIASSTDVKQSEEDIKISRDMIEKSEALAKSAQADLEDTVICAPADGVIVSKIVEEGEVIAAGTPIVTIVDPDKLYLRIFLPTDKAGKLKINNPAKITPDAIADTFDGFVYKISGKAEFTPRNVETKEQRAKLVFEVKVRVKDNKERKLKPGMPAEVKIDIEK